MRYLRVVAALLGVVGAGGFLLGVGCRDATQATLDISLSKNAQCTEIHGTAITVGVDPVDTEERLKQQFITASTQICDPGSRSIGTLVVTPGDSSRASIIVVAAYTETDAAKCAPPAFKGCIVARRRFAFTEYRQLRMPITLDPDCADVPCDAFSTCRSGKCFASESTCSGDTCTEPGAIEDGGTSDEGSVVPDTGVPDGGTDTGAPDGASDGGTGDGSVVDGGGAPYCASTILRCRSSSSPDVACGTSAATCCDTAQRTGDCTVDGNTCTGARYCCVQSDCLAGQKCVGATSTSPGSCNKEDAGTVSCAAGTLMCPSPGSNVAENCTPGSAKSCCLSSGAPACQAAPVCAPGETRYCCTASDCPNLSTCPPPDSTSPNAPRMCSKQVVVSDAGPAIP